MQEEAANSDEEPPDIEEFIRRKILFDE